MTGLGFSDLLPGDGLPNLELLQLDPLTAGSGEPALEVTFRRSGGLQAAGEFELHRVGDSHDCVQGGSGDLDLAFRQEFLLLEIRQPHLGLEQIALDRKPAAVAGLGRGEMRAGCGHGGLDDGQTLPGQQHSGVGGRGAGDDLLAHPLQRLARGVPAQFGLLPAVPGLAAVVKRPGGCEVGCEIVCRVRLVEPIDGEVFRPEALLVEFGGKHLGADCSCAENLRSRSAGAKTRPGPGRRAARQFRLAIGTPIETGSP